MRKVSTREASDAICKSPRYLITRLHDGRIKGGKEGDVWWVNLDSALQHVNENPAYVRKTANNRCIVEKEVDCHRINVGCTDCERLVETPARSLSQSSSQMLYGQ
jgi:hypothetical protein